MSIYQCKTKRFGATRYDELIKQARRLFHDIESRSKRKAYIRSAYFNKEKVFFDYFWEHLRQKPERERKRRLKYFPCGIELIQISRHAPHSTQNPNRRNEIWYRFDGKTREAEYFFVQIKFDIKRKHYYLMSVFSK